MRKELELIEKIEKYLNGQLTATEKMEFEKELASNPSLKEQVDLQKQVQQGVQRIQIKKQVQQAFKKYKWTKNFKNWGLGGLSMAIVATAIVFFTYKNPVEKSNPLGMKQPLPELNENGEKLWSDADKYLPAQYFELDPAKDTVIETEQGIVFSIPANCFLNADGKPAKSPIKLEIKEALDANSIIQAGLSTRSGNQQLESAGMFYLNARAENETLKIDPYNSVYAEIPAAKKKEGMMLFEGKRLSDGTIDWTNPKPLENYLIPVDINTLDFYPPKYIDSLAAMGRDVKNKTFTDSLYYSFAFQPTPPPVSAPNPFGILADSTRTDTIKTFQTVRHKDGSKIFKQNCAMCHRLDNQRLTGPGLAGVADRVPQPTNAWLFKYIKNNLQVKKSGDKYAQKLSNDGGGIMTVFDGTISDEDIKALVNYLTNTKKHENAFSSDPVDPAKVKAIWNEKFNNTLISTKQFEERLKYMHSACNGSKALDLYINNIEKNMCTIDSIAAKTTGDDKFYEFAARGNGKVKADRKQLEKLKFYYENKSKAYAQAVAKTQEKFMKEQERMNKRAENVREKQNEKERIMNWNNFNEEFKINLKEAYRQLGKPYVERPLPRSTYGVSISMPGWKNIDAYVVESTLNHTTLNYTAENGKKAVIKYEPISVQISGEEGYDRVLAYLIPDQLDGFTRMKDGNGKFTESLNELLKYKLICIGYKGSDVFLYTNDMVNLRTYDKVSLNKVDQQTLKNELNKLKAREQTGLILDDVDYQQFDLKEQQRQNKLWDLEVFRNHIQHIIFPCIPEGSMTESRQ